MIPADNTFHDPLCGFFGGDGQFQQNVFHFVNRNRTCNCHGKSHKAYNIHTHIESHYTVGGQNPAPGLGGITWTG